NVIITPHCAAASPRVPERHLETLLDNVRRFVAGGPPGHAGGKQKWWGRAPFRVTPPARAPRPTRGTRKERRPPPPPHTPPPAPPSAPRPPVPRRSPPPPPLHRPNVPARAPHRRRLPRPRRPHPPPLHHEGRAGRRPGRPPALRHRPDLPAGPLLPAAPDLRH